MSCMEEVGILTQTLTSSLKAGSKIISLLREDASKMIPIMLDPLKLIKIKESLKMAKEPYT